MGWALLAAVALASVGAALLLRLPRALISIFAAALMLGAAGYALQGRPLLGGKPRETASRAVTVDRDLVALRTSMVGQFTPAHPYLVASDALIGSGSANAAAQWLRSGIAREPDNYALWMELGTALFVNDGGVISPASKFAFRRALVLAPRHPAPPFFYGLALIRAGEFAQARAWWERAVALAPAAASYRAELQERLAELDRFLALVAEIEAAEASQLAAPN